VFIKQLVIIVFLVLMLPKRQPVKIQQLKMAQINVLSYLELVLVYLELFALIIPEIAPLFVKQL
jgi:hypothetical protein